MRVVVAKRERQQDIRHGVMLAPPELKKFQLPLIPRGESRPIHEAINVFRLALRQCRWIRQHRLRHLAFRLPLPTLDTA